MLKYDYEEYRRCKARLVAAGRLPDNDSELAAIEREIGRAVIGESMALRARSRSTDYKVNYILTDAAIYAEQHADALITRYRALLAAGAEEGR